MGNVLNEDGFMSSINIGGILRKHHDLHLGSMYKGDEVNIYKMCIMENAHMIHFPQSVLSKVL